MRRRDCDDGRQNHMAAGVQSRGWGGPSRRRVPRFRVQTPLDVTVLRSGVPDVVPGRSLNVCERGLAAMMAGELLPGEAVALEVWLPAAAEALRARALVRYQDKLRCGLEFVGLTAEQRTGIRDWARISKAETDSPVSVMLSSESGAAPALVTAGARAVEAAGGKGAVKGGGGSGPGGSGSKPSKGRRGAGWTLVLIVAAIAVAAFWWKWNRAWDELEAGLKTQQAAAADRPQAQVPAEVMQRLLVHRVEPAYPPEARKGKLEGIIALDIVVGRDGSVLSMHPLNGPDVLAKAAMDALRWWKFEPYRLNGEPAVVETTVAVEFKL